jgi:hypothetical protein
MNREISVETLSNELLSIMRAARNDHGSINLISKPSAGADVNHQDLLTCATLHHIGLGHIAARDYGEKTATRARELGVKHILDVAKLAAKFEGRPAGSPDDLIRASGISSISLPNILGNSLRVAVVAAYRESPRSWEGFAAKKPVDDFRDHTGVRGAAFENLSQLPAGGEVKHATITEENTFVYSADTFAKMVSVDRRDIVNDNAGFFVDVSNNLGRSASRSVSDLVYRTLLANGGNFFHTNNGNVQTGALTVLQYTSLGTAISKMVKQTDSNGNPIDVYPKLLLVPPELTEMASQILQSEYISVSSAVADPNKGMPTGNPYRNSLAMAVEPRLSNSNFSGYSETAWYLFAEPALAAVIVAFLDGREAPTVENWTPSDTPDRLAYSWRVFLDFGAALGDPKAAFRSAGV